jgi:amino acid transporter
MKKNPNIFQNPVRDLPRAIAISCVLCLAIYVLTVIAFHTTLSTYEVLGSEAVAVTFANRLYGKVNESVFRIRSKIAKIRNTGKYPYSVFSLYVT